MPTGDVHHLCLPNCRMRGADRLRSIKDGSKHRWSESFRVAQSLVCLLLLLVMLRVLGQGLLMGVAAAALVLLLQEAVDPTPLFWTAPWEAVQLLLSRACCGNHIWLHRTQELARESIGLSSKLDGFAMVDGFVLIGIGRHKQFVQWTAEAAWLGIVQTHTRARHPRECKAVRFLVAVCLRTGGLFALGAWRVVDLSTALLVAMFSGAGGHALARPFENRFGKRLAGFARHQTFARAFTFEVEPSSFRNGLGGAYARDLSSAEFLKKNQARISSYE